MTGLNEWYHCYSIGLKKFLEAHGIDYASNFINKNTGKTCWLYFVTPEVSEILKAWSKESKRRYKEKLKNGINM